MTAPWLAIVGIGEDGAAGLGEAARAAVARADAVFGGARHLALAAPLIRGAALPWPSPFSDAYPAVLARRGTPVAVLASGDPFCFGVGARLASLVAAGEWRAFPAPSSFTLARARLGWAAEETATISFCGRPLAAAAPLLQPGARVLALSADASTPAALAALLAARGFGATRMRLMEALGGAAERVRETTAAGFDLAEVHPLNLVALEVRGGAEARVLPLASGLPDALFEHDGQFSRREMRALTLSALAPRRGETLWDVGAGSGSVGIEWMLRHPANRAIAIERDPARAARIVRNAEALGVPGLTVVEGAAPEALAGLPAPDAVFLGGGAHLPGVIDAAWAALPPGGRIVANAVTLETEATLLAARARLGGSLSRIGIERMDKVGPMHAYRPAMTVTQWAAEKP
ncbi:MAG: precorrin-6y C5,15-methyltransferase (decarboxylating) subunit CbiE [Proteobacteria bacterium]|nr:precorrin-6y C5,15-methyltransferase (decarboxylating) subunit CbiE [Pseudomonadota bacterium]